MLRALQVVCLLGSIFCGSVVAPFRQIVVVGDAVTFIFQKLDNVQGLEDFSVSGLLGSPGSGFFVNPKIPL